MFGEGEMELLTLSSALDPKFGYKSFEIDDISSLVEKYYPLTTKNGAWSCVLELRLFWLRVFMLKRSQRSELTDCKNEGWHL